ncbi:MAG: hypothetical protein IJD22_00860 [Clostridia bacterium]|nr:hypothetical protein [Clostridia bacterium]
MKKIISALLLFAMAISLFACGAKPELCKMDISKIASVSFTAITGVDIDKNTFIEAYNKAEVVKAASEKDKDSDEVIVVSFAGGKDHFTLYYTKDNRFTVTGSVVETEYVIEAPELSKLYNGIAHPEAKLVAMDEDKVEKVTLTVDTDITVDVKAFTKAYNEAELVGAASTESGNNVILFIYENSEAVFEVTLIKDDQFRVSGTLVEADFIIKSAELARLYSEATK